MSRPIYVKERRAENRCRTQDIEKIKSIKSLLSIDNQAARVVYYFSLLGCRQAVRHGTLTPAFVSSNLAIPAKDSHRATELPYGYLLFEVNVCRTAPMLASDRFSRRRALRKEKTYAKTKFKIWPSQPKIPHASAGFLLFTFYFLLFTFYLFTLTKNGRIFGEVIVKR